MKKSLLTFVAAAWLLAAPRGVSAQALAVFADLAFQDVLQEVAPGFTDQTGFEVQLSLGQSAILADSIRSGTAADLFLPASEEVMRQMMEKGLVDETLKRNILLLPGTAPAAEGLPPEPQRISAAVLSGATNRLQAMAFLEYLTSEPVRGAFAHHGFALP